MNNPESMGSRPEQGRTTFDSVDEIRENFVWVGNPQYPDRTEDEAWKHVESYIHDGDNEFVSERELVEEMGFAKKESTES